MKIGILFLSNQKMGGVYQYSLSFIDALLKNKNVKELTVFTNKNDLNIKNAKVIFIKNYSLKLIFSIFLGAMSIFPKLLFKKIDLLFAPAYSPLLFLSKSQINITIHDLQEIYFPENFNKTTLLWRKFMYQRIKKIASNIITESSYVKEDIARYLNFNKDKIHVIESPPYFDKWNLTLNTEEEFKNYINQNFEYIFFPAQFWKHKNHERVLKAFLEFSKDFKLVKMILTGNKNREYNSILDLITKLKLRDKIIFFHRIPQKFMPYFFKNSVFTIAPTLHESISIPVFEAFQYQSPVCASGILAIKDQVSDCGLLFNPESIEDIYKCMHKLYVDRDLREKLKLKGKKRLKYFSVSRFNKKINKIL